MDALRTAFLAQADEQALRSAVEAEEAEACRVAAARRRAQEVVREARTAAEAAALPDVARIRATAARQARHALLSAQREVFEQFRQEAHAAALALRDGPAYAALLEQLSRRAREQLGQTAKLHVDPAGVGGVIAREGDRQVDYSLPALVDRCIVALGERVEELWR